MPDTTRLTLLFAKRGITVAAHRIGENNADLALTLAMLLDAEPDMQCVATAASDSAVLAAVDDTLPMPSSSICRLMTVRAYR